MKKDIFKKTAAFTMLELIFVVVVVGILAAVLIPRMGQSRLREAADQIASHIRYTQHLAMQDDKYNERDDANWYKRRWQIVFQDIGKSFRYSVFSDKAGGNTGNPDISEIATNPLNPSLLLSGGSSGGLKDGNPRITKSMNIGKEYGITGVNFGDSCSIKGGGVNSRRIVFDYLGRPLKGDLSSYGNPYSKDGNSRLITQLCTITLTNNAGENINITIQPETGYTSVGSIY